MLLRELEGGMIGFFSVDVQEIGHAECIKSISQIGDCRSACRQIVRNLQHVDE